MRSPMIRAKASAGPPAANGTTIVTGRRGKACDHAMREAAGSVAAPSATPRNCRRFIIDLTEKAGRAHNAHGGTTLPSASLRETTQSAGMCGEVLRKHI